MLEQLGVVRDRVLDNARLLDGETLLDVGCGNGLIAFGALERGAGEVIFADVSLSLLDDCRGLAREAGVLDRCRFVNAPAEDLAAVEDGSVDVVTTRAVLIYVKDKAQAFAEFHRVLRSGGRISLFEPINRFGMEERRCTWGYDLDEDAARLMQKVNGVFEKRQPRDDPMLDFEERDLFRLAEEAGFFPVNLEFRAEATPVKPRGWASFVHSSGNPKIPTFAEAMNEALTALEQERLVAVLRPAVEEGRGVWRMGLADLWAVKPT